MRPIATSLLLKSMCLPLPKGSAPLEGGYHEPVPGIAGQACSLLKPILTLQEALNRLILAVLRSEK